MGDTQNPPVRKPGLPFKRTVARKPTTETTPIDHSGLSLFSRSKEYFPTVVEDQQRRAREKAAKAEKERKEKLAREEKEKQEALEAKARREERRKKELAELREKENARKHPRLVSLSSDDESDNVFDERPSKSRRSSTPHSPEKKKHGSARLRESSGPPSARTRRHIQVHPLSDSSDDDDSTRRKPSTSRTPSKPSNKNGSLVVDSDSDVEAILPVKKKGDNDEEDPSEYYIRAAQERMQKAKEERLAREAAAAAAGASNDHNTPTPAPDSPTVSIMIAAPKMPDAKPLSCTIRIDQALQIAFDTFKEKMKRDTKYPHEAIAELIFTWRSGRVYDRTKPETLNIRPRGPDGRLHDSFSSAEGYRGRDKVYFEAWSPDDYDAMKRKRERDLMIERGEYPEEADENNLESQAATQNSDEDERVKVTFRARDMQPRNVTLRKYSTVAHMIKAFRKLSGIGEDKHVEIRWDGEVLDLETTVEEAEIGNLDSVEVHIR